jgi:hypothetical protein
VLQSRNDVRFRNYQKYGAELKVVDESAKMTNQLLLHHQQNEQSKNPPPPRQQYPLRVTKAGYRYSQSTTPTPTKLKTKPAKPAI